MRSFRLVLISAALVASSSTFAAIDGASFEALASTNANINSGNWNVAGFLSFVKNSGRNSDGTEYSATVTGKYFLINRFALGLGLGMDGATGENTLASVGPTASYFFWQSGKLASHVDVGFRFGLTSATVKSFIQGSLGLEYFLAPVVALGPALFYNHYNSRFSDYQRYGITFNLGIYL